MLNKLRLKRKVITSLIALSIFSLGCANQVTNGVSSAMFKHWIHSHEEDSEGIKVYRPSDYNFPPSRGREGFELKENGEFIIYGIGATDKYEAIVGTWKAEGENKIQVSFDNQNEQSFTLDIVASDEDVLKIRR